LTAHVNASALNKQTFSSLAFSSLTPSCKKFWIFC
jgi:hypothetical protein